MRCIPSSCMRVSRLRHVGWILQISRISVLFTYFRVYHRMRYECCHCLRSQSLFSCHSLPARVDFVYRVCLSGKRSKFSYYYYFIFRRVRIIEGLFSVVLYSKDIAE